MINSWVSFFNEGSARVDTAQFLNISFLFGYMVCVTHKCRGKFINFFFNVVAINFIDNLCSFHIFVVTLLEIEIIVVKADNFAVIAFEIIFVDL